MLDTVKINHVQHISFTQSRLTDAVSVILSELLSYEHPSNVPGVLVSFGFRQMPWGSGERHPALNAGQLRKGVADRGLGDCGVVPHAPGVTSVKCDAACALACTNVRSQLRPSTRLRIVTASARVMVWFG